MKQSLVIIHQNALGEDWTQELAILRAALNQLSQAQLYTYILQKWELRKENKRAATITLKMYKSKTAAMRPRAFASSIVEANSQWKSQNPVDCRVGSCYLVTLEKQVWRANSADFKLDMMQHDSV